MNNNFWDILTEIKNKYDSIYEPLIKPVKIPFEECFLGQRIQFKNGFEYHKENFNFINFKNNKIYYTLYNIKSKKKIDKCLIYLHSHSSNRIEGYHLLDYCGKLNISLCLIDFASCGKSEGEYISLGYNESIDVKNLLKILKNKFNSFIIWGRSMGAVTALKTCIDFDENLIEYWIIDSPYLNIKNFVNKFIKNNINLPNLIIKAIYSIIKSQIFNKIQVDISKINSKYYASQIKIPTILIGSTNDELINFKDFEKIYNNLFTNKKYFHKINNSHIDQRNKDILKPIFTILKNNLKDSKNSKFKFLSPKINYKKSYITKGKSPFKKTFTKINNNNIENLSLTHNKLSKFKFSTKSQSKVIFNPCLVNNKIKSKKVASKKSFFYMKF